MAEPVIAPIVVAEVLAIAALAQVVLVLLEPNLGTATILVTATDDGTLTGVPRDKRGPQPCN